MLDHLYHAFLNATLVDGASHSLGWGGSVRQQILPLLQHPKLIHHRHVIEEGLKRTREPISVFVVGEGKFGKSTLINALAGYEIATVNFLPATWHITRYIPPEKSDSGKIEIHYDERSEHASRFETYCRQAGIGLKTGQGLAVCNLESQLAAVVEHEETTRKKGEQSPIWQVTRPVSLNLADRRPLTLVDTPGIRQVQIGSNEDESIEDFYHYADVVLWLLVADKLNSKETRDSLSSMSRYGKPIILVINRADNIPADGKDRVLREARKQYGSLVEDIILISARDAYMARSTQDKALLSSSALPNLENRIEDLAGLRGDVTKALSLYTTCQQAAVECASILRQEAVRLDDNLNRFQRNKETAGTYTGIAQKTLEREMASVSGPLNTATINTMRRTANMTGSDDTPVFDEKKVRDAIRDTSMELIKKIGRSLERDLTSVQSRILAVPYFDQIYGADATIKAHLSQTSFSAKTAQVGGHINLGDFEPQFSFSDMIQNIMEGLSDFLAENFDWGLKRSEQEKQSARRSRLLERYIEGLDPIIEACSKEIEENLKEGVKQTSNALATEVTHSFNAKFSGVESVRREVIKCRDSAEQAVVPTLFEVTTRMLASTLNNRKG